jgi:hypothetical protein
MPGGQPFLRDVEQRIWTIDDLSSRRCASRREADALPGPVDRHRSDCFTVGTFKSVQPRHGGKH